MARETFEEFSRMSSQNFLTCVEVIREEFSKVLWVNRRYNTPPWNLRFRYPTLHINFSDIDTKVIYGLRNLRGVLQDEFLEFFDMCGNYLGWVLIKKVVGKQTLQYSILTPEISIPDTPLQLLCHSHCDHIWLGKLARSSPGWVLRVFWHVWKLFGMSAQMCCG